MKRTKFSLLLLLVFPLALQAADPDTLCETRTATIPVPSYKHCKAGDLVEVDAFELARLCVLNGPVLATKDKFLCVYRGERRSVRNRPLTETEKAYDKQQVESLVDK